MENVPYILSQNFTKMTAVSRIKSYIFGRKYIVYILRRNWVVLSEPVSNKSGGTRIPGLPVQTLEAMVSNHITAGTLVGGAKLMSQT